MAHRALDGPEDVIEYANYLDEGWPVRRQLMAHICERLQEQATQPLTVLELCVGPGALSQEILQNVPIAKYVGIDITPASIDYVKGRTGDINVETVWFAADLNNDDWLSLVDSDFDVIVAMQSVHDLGGEAEVRRIYGKAHSLLRNEGLFINADLLRDESDPPDTNPGRFTVPRHAEMLQDAGFAQSECTLEVDGFACLEARK